MSDDTAGAAHEQGVADGNKAERERARGKFDAEKEEQILEALLAATYKKAKAGEGAAVDRVLEILKQKRQLRRDREAREQL